MAISKKLINSVEPIILTKTDFESMDEYISQLYDIEDLSLKQIEIHLNNVLNGTEKVHGRQLDIFGHRQGERSKTVRNRIDSSKDAEQLDLFGEGMKFNNALNFLKNSYDRYVSRVLSKLEKIMGRTISLNNKIEEYIKDFYDDNFSPEDCAWAIRDDIKCGDIALSEDFSMGVGAPLGLDQGIPHSGDCKGVMPVRMQFVKSTGTKPNPKFAKPLKPQYWLNQIPKKKKRKKSKRIHESMAHDFKNFCDEIIYSLGYNEVLGRRIINKYMDDIIAEFEDTMDVEKISKYIESQQGMKLEGYSKEVYDYIKSNNLISNNPDDLKLNKYTRDQLNNLMEAIIRAIKSKDVVGLFDVRKEAKKLKDELKNYVFENKKLVIESLAKFMLASTYFGQNNFDQGKYNLFLIHENIENLSHSIVLKEHKKKEYFTILDEGAMDILKKIPQVLKGFKKDIDSAKKEGDKEALVDKQEDIKDLKDEIYDKGILNKFRNNKGLAKAIFAAMAVLMLSAGASSAHAAATAGSNFSNTGNHASFESVMDNLDQQINAACGDSESCHVHQYGVSDSDSNSDHSNDKPWKINVEKQKITNDGGMVLKVSFDGTGDGVKDGESVVHFNSDGQPDKVSIHYSDGSSHESKNPVKTVNTFMPNLTDYAKYQISLHGK